MNKKPIVSQIGRSYLGLGIESFEFKASDRSILVVGGVHGDEVEGVDLCRMLIAAHMDNQIRDGISYLPCLNVDGYLLHTRANFNGVDLNRNLNTSNWIANAVNERYQPGSQPLSEIENKVFVQEIKRVNPQIIISLHSFTKKLFLWNGIEKSLSTNVVTAASTELGIDLVSKMNYDVYGSLSIWGRENGIDVLTVEAPRGDEWNIWRDKYFNSLKWILNEL